MKNFILSHWRQIAGVLILLVAVFLFTPDQAYNVVYAVGGLLLLRHAITAIDRYWARKGKDISLSNFMQNANNDQRSVIYASIILAIAFIIGSVMGGN